MSDAGKGNFEVSKIILLLVMSLMPTMNHTLFYGPTYFGPSFVGLF